MLLYCVKSEVKASKIINLTIHSFSNTVTTKSITSATAAIAHKLS